MQLDAAELGHTGGALLQTLLLKLLLTLTLLLQTLLLTLPLTPLQTQQVAVIHVAHNSAGELHQSGLVISSTDADVANTAADAAADSTTNEL